MAKSHPLIPRVLREHEEQALTIRGWAPPIGTRFLIKDPETGIIRRWEIIEHSEGKAPDSYSDYRHYAPNYVPKYVSKAREILDNPDDLPREVEFAGAREFEKWINHAIAQGEAWERHRWQRFAEVGSIFLKKIRNPTSPKADEARPQEYEAYVKFDRGTGNEVWTILDREIPLFDDETLEALSTDELMSLRNVEERCATRRMDNVSAIERELKRRNENDFHL